MCFPMFIASSTVASPLFLSLLRGSFRGGGGSLSVHRFGTLLLLVDAIRNHCSTMLWLMPLSTCFSSRRSGSRLTTLYSRAAGTQDTSRRAEVQAGEVLLRLLKPAVHKLAGVMPERQTSSCHSVGSKQARKNTPLLCPRLGPKLQGPVGNLCSRVWQ